MHFVEDESLQGLKPNSLSFLYGPTKVVLNKAKTQHRIELLLLKYHTLGPWICRNSRHGLQPVHEPSKSSGL
jgi:hypothetical protein